MFMLYLSNETLERKNNLKISNKKRWQEGVGTSDVVLFTFASSLSWIFAGDVCHLAGSVDLEKA